MLNRGRPGARLALLLVAGCLASACAGRPTPAASTPQAPAPASAPAAASPPTTGAVPAANASKPDPCQIASASDIQAALGVAVVGSGTSTPLGCEWKLANGARLHFQDYGVSGTQEFQTLLGATCGGMNQQANQCTTVSGLGQKATFVESRGADPKDIIGRSVVVLLPDDIMEVGQSNSDDGPPSGEDALVKLAHIVAGRIP